MLGKFSTPNQNTPPDLADHGVVKHMCVVQILKNNSVVSDIDDDPAKPNPRTGIDKILWYMVRTGLLVQLDSKAMSKYGSKSKVGYKITEDFKLAYMGTLK